MGPDILDLRLTTLSETISWVTVTSWCYTWRRTGRSLRWLYIGKCVKERDKEKDDHQKAFLSYWDTINRHSNTNHQLTSPSTSSLRDVATMPTIPYSSFFLHVLSVLGGLFYTRSVRGDMQGGIQIWAWSCWVAWASWMGSSCLSSWPNSCQWLAPVPPFIDSNFLQCFAPIWKCRTDHSSIPATEACSRIQDPTQTDAALAAAYISAYTYD